MAGQSGRSVPDGLSSQATEPKVSALRASIPSAERDFLATAIQLIVAIEWEVPPIRDGVGVDHRCDVLATRAKEARETLKKHGVDPDISEEF